MKVLLISGSPRDGGNTKQALDYMAEIFRKNGIETAEIEVPTDTEGCRACGGCAKTGKCVVDDRVNEAAKLWEEADGMVIGSPVYFSGISGQLKAFLDRLFYSAPFDRRFKVAAGIAAVRRAGSVPALDQLNHFLLYGGMTVAGSTYWPMVYGRAPGEMMQDAEGLETIENLANNMIFLMKSIAEGRKQFKLPAQKEPKVYTNFIR